MVAFFWVRCLAFQVRHSIQEKFAWHFGTGGGEQACILVVSDMQLHAWAFPECMVRMNCMCAVCLANPWCFPVPACCALALAHVHVGRFNTWWKCLIYCVYGNHRCSGCTLGQGLCQYASLTGHELCLWISAEEMQDKNMEKYGCPWQETFVKEIVWHGLSYPGTLCFQTQVCLILGQS